MFLFPAFVITYAIVNQFGWNLLQLVIVGLAAFDISGGISVNASNSAKRWWHRPGQGFLQHVGFVAAHVHPFVLALLFAAFTWQAAAIIYVYLLVATLFILWTPSYLHRPVAFVLYAIALLLGSYVVSVPSGFEWFVPFYYLKLLLAHLLREPTN